MKRLPPKRSALAAFALSLSFCWPAHAGQPELDAMGLDQKFVADALSEFKAMGFDMKVGAVDFDSPEAQDAAAKLGTKSAVFSIVSGFGKKATCVVGIRSSTLRQAPERHLVGGVGSLGGDKREAWRIAFRHELGHCALQYAMLDPRDPDPFLSEPFADVFSLDWTSKVDGDEGRRNVELYARTRQLVSRGAHDTWGAIQRWKAAPRAASPCEAAWRATPYDTRGPAKACPKF